VIITFTEQDSRWLAAAGIEQPRTDRDSPVCGATRGANC
jgi:hypothetical protein